MLTKVDKALVAALSAAVLAYTTAQASGADQQTSLIAAAGGLVVGFLTWLVKNKDA